MVRVELVMGRVPTRRWTIFSDDVPPQDEPFSSARVDTHVETPHQRVHPASPSSTDGHFADLGGCVPAFPICYFPNLEIAPFHVSHPRQSCATTFREAIVQPIYTLLLVLGAGGPDRLTGCCRSFTLGEDHDDVQVGSGSTSSCCSC